MKTVGMKKPSLKGMSNTNHLGDLNDGHLSSGFKSMSGISAHKLSGLKKTKVEKSTLGASQDGQAPLSSQVQSQGAPGASVALQEIAQESKPKKGI